MYFNFDDAILPHTIWLYFLYILINFYMHMVYASATKVIDIVQRLVQFCGKDVYTHPPRLCFISRRYIIHSAFLTQLINKYLR